MAKARRSKMCIARDCVVNAGIQEKGERSRG